MTLRLLYTLVHRHKSDPRIGYNESARQSVDISFKKKTNTHQRPTDRLQNSTIQKRKRQLLLYVKHNIVGIGFKMAVLENVEK